VGKPGRLLLLVEREQTGQVTVGGRVDGMVTDVRTFAVRFRMLYQSDAAVNVFRKGVTSRTMAFCELSLLSGVPEIFSARGGGGWFNKFS
jgi:hypothetical protein